MKRIAFYSFIFFSLLSKAQSPFTAFRYNLEAENYVSAQEVLDSCSFVKYQEDSVLYFKGLLTLKKGNVKGAKIHFENLRKTYPAFTEANYLNALIYFTEEDYGNSIKEFTRVITQNPSHVKARYNRSIAYGLLEDYLLAIDDLTACINLDSTNAMAYCSRGYWYEYSSRYAEAKKDYEKTIRLDPKNYDAYFGLAYVYQSQKENTKACETINKAILAGSQIAVELKEIFCRQQGQ